MGDPKDPKYLYVKFQVKSPRVRSSRANKLADGISEEKCGSDICIYI